MTDRLKDTPEFEAATDLNISLSDLLKIAVSDEILINLNSANFILLNSQVVYRGSDGETSQGVRLKFEANDGYFNQVKGAISLGTEETGAPELELINVRDSRKGTTWIYSKVNRHVSIALPGTEPTNFFHSEGYRTIRKGEEELLVFDNNQKRVEDNTKKISLEAHQRGLEISAYVLKTALANPSIFNKSIMPWNN